MSLKALATLVCNGIEDQFHTHFYSGRTSNHMSEPEKIVGKTELGFLDNLRFELLSIHSITTCIVVCPLV